MKSTFDADGEGMIGTRATGPVENRAGGAHRVLGNIHAAIGNTGDTRIAYGRGRPGGRSAAP
jgi:hypothetical protein